MSDQVKHPDHYQSENGLECWDAMEVVYGSKAVETFCKLNAFKYLWRLGKKDDPGTELQKVAEYKRKEEALRSGADVVRSDVYYLQMCRSRLQCMIDDLDREIIETTIQKRRFHETL